MALDVANSDAAYGELLDHVGHEVTVVNYANGQNVAIECETCGCVLIDFDKPGTDPNFVS